MIDIKKYNSKKIYTTFDGKVRIAPNAETYNDDEYQPIYISNLDEGNMYLGLTIEQAQEIAKYLMQITCGAEDQIRVGDRVEVVSGIFTGAKGIVYDIDEVASKNELTIKIPKSENNDEIYLYIDISNVEKLI